MENEGNGRVVGYRGVEGCMDMLKGRRRKTNN